MIREYFAFANCNVSATLTNGCSTRSVHYVHRVSLYAPGTCICPFVAGESGRPAPGPHSSALRRSRIVLRQHDFLLPLGSHVCRMVGSVRCQWGAFREQIGCSAPIGFDILCVFRCWQFWNFDFVFDENVRSYKSRNSGLQSWRSLYKTPVISVMFRIRNAL